MGDLTTNYEFYKPSISEVGWGDEINNNFDIIDSLISNLYQDLLSLQNEINSISNSLNLLQQTVDNIINIELPKKIENIPTKMFSSSIQYHCLYCSNAANYTNASSTNNRLYIIPFYTFEKCKINNIGIQVPFNVNGNITAKIGIYKTVSGYRKPNNASLQASVTINIPAYDVGIFTQALNYNLDKTTVYYFGLIISCSVTANILHVGTGATIQFIPKFSNDIGFPTYYFNENVSELPANLPNSYNVALSLPIPAILTSLSAT